MLKSVVSFYFCLFLFISFGQDGYKLIARTKNKIDRGNYTKALKLLDKADSMDYGFCGLAWVGAKQEIAFHRIRILAHNGEYLKAANELNRIDIYEPDEDIDSLKMIYYLKSIDKEILKKEIDSCLESFKSLESLAADYELFLDVRFSEKPLKISYVNTMKIYVETFFPALKDKETLTIDRFRNSVMNRTFYKLLL